jgi:four helix bundle protein
VKKKTPNAQHRTSKAELKKSRPNSAQWSTANVECGLNRSFVELTKSLPNTRAGSHIAGQVLRCGTSPLSNHGEVEAAESRKDFLHNLRICLKELRETKRWLRLVSRLKKLGEPANLQACLNEAEELIRIFAASVKTAEKNATL